MSPAVLAHLAAAVAALGFTTATLVLPKGGRRHRVLGRAAALALVATAMLSNAAGLFAAAVAAVLVPGRVLHGLLLDVMAVLQNTPWPVFLALTLLLGFGLRFKPRAAVAPEHRSPRTADRAAGRGFTVRGGSRQ